MQRAPGEQAEREETRGGDAPGGSLTVAWGLVGVGAILSFAVARLGLRGVLTLREGLTALEWSALGALTLVFVYGEGYRALQRRWIPWVVRRVRRLPHEGRLRDRVLAPLYGMGLVGAPPSQLVRAWGGVVLIVAAVLVVRAFPEPWRGITDFAVAAALGWGVVALARESAGGATAGS